eukprot:Seg1299.2 transcript_id=Seg1299.2/GoldUCD/mRNA.D3Y31 product="hypothetical protein" protein_id=Seg1299.2/GoldUCD/D3Y31
MKLSKVLFWRRHKKAPKSSICEDFSDGATSCENTPDEKEPRPRSASFGGASDHGSKEKVDEKTKNVKRSHSMGHKTARRNSFVRWFKNVRAVGKTLRQIGDDLESQHSGSSMSLSSQRR